MQSIARQAARYPVAHPGVRHSAPRWQPPCRPAVNPETIPEVRA
jgi:hypothetical protein